MKLQVDLAPKWRLVLGSLTLPTVFLLQNSPSSLVSLVLLLLASNMVGYRLWLRRLVPMMLALLCFHLLLPPRGRILWHLPLPWGAGFSLTVGPLFAALFKISLLLQLLFISGFSIAKNIQLPGSWGRKFAQVLILYQLMLKDSRELLLRQPLQSLDRLLCATEKQLTQWQFLDQPEAPDLTPTALRVEKESSQLLTLTEQWHSECVSLGRRQQAGVYWQLSFYLSILTLPCWLLVLQRWL